MKILIANDHKGINIKKKLQDYLLKNRFDVENLGTDSIELSDYPNLAFKLCQKMNHETLGILICGTGIGMSIAANKVKGIRCAKVNNQEEARLSREHNNANVIALSSKLSIRKVKKIIKAFIETKFSDEERHQRRVDLINSYER